MKFIRLLRKPFDYICHDRGAEDLAAKLGDCLAWFASGTDCRCCIGTRVVVAFVVGVGLGLCL